MAMRMAMRAPLWRAVLAAAAAALVGAETHGERGDDYGDVGGGVQVGRGRDGESLGSTSLTKVAQLFPVGRPVNYAVAFPLSSNDPRISAAVREWESKTCIRFNRCRSQSTCPRPYIRFTTGRGCSSPVGVRSRGVNSVSISRGCGVGATIHEIGHSLGLEHEQSRKDRDRFVHVDLSQVQRGMEFNFEKNGRTGRDMGKYDYGSIMHYGAHGFAIGRRPVITAPVPIGQREGLSPVDVAAIQFMYNDCSPTFRQPKCLPSVDTETTHVLQPSRRFVVDFNAVYDPARSMRVSYGQTTAASGVRFVTPDGTKLRDTGYAEMHFTPTRAMAGQAFTLSATFTGPDGSVATCSVRVRVAGGDGRPSPSPQSPSPPTGTQHPVSQPPTTKTPQPQPQPTPQPQTPTPPSPPTGGGVCRESKTFGFDELEDVAGLGSQVAHTQQTKQSGKGALMVRYPHRTTKFPIDSMQPAQFSVYTRLEDVDSQLHFRLISSSGAIVNLLHALRGKTYFKTYDGRSWGSWGGGSRVVRRSEFQNIVAAFDWSSRQFSVSVEGDRVGGSALPSGYTDVVGIEIFVGGHRVPVYVDEMQLLC